MGNFERVILAALTVLSFQMSSFAQSSNSASASATIIVPISVAKLTDLNFGNISVSASMGGTVILGANGMRSIGGSGGVILPATTGTVAAASFNVSGAASFTYAITLPMAPVIITSGSNSMNVISFVSTPSSTGVFSTLGTQTLNVGATLVVSAGQAPGDYTNAMGIPVSVNYN